jgi:glycine/D-amino acid oxidase-like deaminating enzyme
VHWGLEGLAATNKLVEAACQANKDYKQEIVLRDELYRIALTPENVQQMQTTAECLPNICDWLGPTEMMKHCYGATNVLGGLHMHSGCKVIHTPTYLQALWKACENIADERGNGASWSILPSGAGPNEWKRNIGVSDTIVYAAGNGLLKPNDGYMAMEGLKLPVQLVRGQSVELAAPEGKQRQALLSGKYLSPMPDPNMVLVGATHEFKEQAMSRDEVVEELKGRTSGFAQSLWDTSSVHRLTSGTRVQSERGKYGRMPIIGRLPNSEVDAWIFTGLSSRGLLYHGLYGEILVDAILDDSEDTMLARCEDLNWWKSKGHSTSPT